MCSRFDLQLSLANSLYLLSQGNRLERFDRMLFPAELYGDNGMLSAIDKDNIDNGLMRLLSRVNERAAVAGQQTVFCFPLAYLNFGKPETRDTDGSAGDADGGLAEDEAHVTWMGVPSHAAHHDTSSAPKSGVANGFGEVYSLDDSVWLRLEINLNRGRMPFLTIVRGGRGGQATMEVYEDEVSRWTLRTEHATNDTLEIHLSKSFKDVVR